jgi:hypothetical protein
MRSTQWVDARKKPETYYRRLRIFDAADARWLQAAPQHLSVTQHYRLILNFVDISVYLKFTIED